MTNTSRSDRGYCSHHTTPTHCRRSCWRERPPIAPPKCTDLADFLKRADNGFKLMHTETQLRLVTDDLFEQLRDDHGIYAEIRFAPLLHTEHGLRPEEEDPHLIGHLQEQRIHLEVCPTCNVQTDNYAEYKDHPIHRLFELGFSVGVNTDARTMSNITLSGECRKLHETFGWGNEHFFRCNRDALQASFHPEKEEARLLIRLADEYGKP